MNKINYKIQVFLANRFINKHIKNKYNCAKYIDQYRLRVALADIKEADWPIWPAQDYIILKDTVIEELRNIERALRTKQSITTHLTSPNKLYRSYIESRINEN